MGLSVETILTIILLLSVTYLGRDILFPRNKQVVEEEDNSEKNKLRNFVDVLHKEDCKVVVFYGSQTGTAEEYSERIKKEAERKYNLKIMVCDPEDYDMEYLDLVPSDATVIFITSTHGEGEPPDNISDLFNLLVDQDNLDLSNNFNATEADKPLQNLHFMVFGLGNSTYQHFNKVSLDLEHALQKFGAKLIGEHGIGDDDKDLEEDFVEWKKKLWPLLVERYGLELVENKKVEPSFKILELDNNDDKIIQHGEFENKYNTDIINSKNPFYSRIINTKHLCHLDHERECLHVELDISDMKNKPAYESGDHVAIWPINPKSEVEMIMNMFNIQVPNKRIMFKSLKNNDNLQLHKIPFFTNTTTYYSLFAYYLDITQPIRRDFVEELYENASLPEAKEYLKLLMENFSLVTSVRSTVGRVLTKLSEIIKEIKPNSHVTFPNTEINVTLEHIVEYYSKIMPRYYSISSSPKKYKNTIHVTASILNYDVLLPDNSKRKVYGLCTNNLLAVHDYLNLSSKNQPSYELENMMTHYKIDTPFVPIYIRKSNFKLPKNKDIPIILVGPGTGLAPLRGFLQERLIQHHENNGDIGTTLLYFGCRNDKDFIYRDELERTFEILNKTDKNSTLNVAFSRKQKEKIYVQHLIKKNKKLIYDLVVNKEARIYVCGDGKNMSRDVSNAFVSIIKESQNDSNDKIANEFVNNLKNKHFYMEDVWT